MRALESYRIYHVGSGGRLRLGESYQASEDKEAVVKAQALLLRGQPAELWQGGRLVGRFSDAHEFTPDRG